MLIKGCVKATLLAILSLLAISALLLRAQVNPALQSSATNALAQEQLPEALKRAKEGNISPLDATTIAEAGALQAIPDLRRDFEVVKDEVSKNAIASALVKLGDKDPGPWDYLVDGAASAVTRDVPARHQYDINGKLVPTPTPEYLAWAKTHGLTLEDADTLILTDMLKISFLGQTGDKRAIPLLRQALLSRNFYVQFGAAEALAKFQDKASIPLIIQACESAPAEEAFGLASSLLKFNDPKAHAAALRFREKKQSRFKQEITQSRLLRTSSNS